MLVLFGVQHIYKRLEIKFIRVLTLKPEVLHSRSGEMVGNWVGNQLPAGWDTRLEWAFFQFLAVGYSESKNPLGY